MVEHRTLNLEVPSSIPTDGTVLCPSCSMAHWLPEYWLQPRKRWLCPDMLEQLLTGLLKPQYKQTKFYIFHQCSTFVFSLESFGVQTFYVCTLFPFLSGINFIVKVMTKGFEEAKKSNENPSPELKPLIGYFMAVELVKHTTDGVTAARLIEQHSLKMEHIPSTLLTSKEVTMCFSSFMKEPVREKNNNLGSDQVRCKPGTVTEIG